MYNVSRCNKKDQRRLRQINRKGYNPISSPYYNMMKTLIKQTDKHIHKKLNIHHYDPFVLCLGVSMYAAVDFARYWDLTR